MAIHDRYDNPSGGGNIKLKQFLYSNSLPISLGDKNTITYAWDGNTDIPPPDFVIRL